VSYSVDIFFGVTLLLLVVAIVVLFAMLGELASRIPAAAEPERAVRPLDRARIGAAPAEWPAPLEDLLAQSRQATAMLVVLSTSCATCQTVAEQIAQEQRYAGRPKPGFAVLVSCAAAGMGEEFVERHGLEAVPHFVDAGGRWVSNSFGISVSPCVLLVENGVLTSAFVFQDFAAMQTAVQTAVPQRSTSKEERWPVNQVPARAPSADGESSLSSAQVP
jgi:hypothetical protein